MLIYSNKSEKKFNSPKLFYPFQFYTQNYAAFLLLSCYLSVPTLFQLLIHIFKKFITHCIINPHKHVTMNDCPKLEKLLILIIFSLYCKIKITISLLFSS